LARKGPNCVNLAGMKQAQHTIELETRGQGLYEITNQVNEWTAVQGIDTGMLTIYCRHTSASLVIQENADPDVMTDLEAFFKNTVPEDLSLYRHRSEGADDMPAHIKAALTDVAINIPVAGAAPLLGTWQGIYLFEHRIAAHRRQLVLHLSGE
jgi:secondary thiamine-phosphate synthase enzyme